MERDYAPIDPFASGWRRKTISRRAWIGVGLIAYLGFVATCFYMEPLARAKFRVPSKADIEAITDRKERIRTEAARTNALADMRAWTPYAVYDTAVGVVVIGGTLAAIILGAILLWRGVRRDSIFVVKRMVVGIAVVAMASLALLVWPPIVADQRCEAQRTTAADGR